MDEGNKGKYFIGNKTKRRQGIIYLIIPLLNNVNIAFRGMIKCIKQLSSMKYLIICDLDISYRAFIYYIVLIL